MTHDSTRTVPFTSLEEAVFSIERAYTPWNVQLEIEAGSRLDVARLRRAARAACEVHPLARARRRPNGGLDTGYAWEIPEQPPDVPLQAVTADGADLHATRTAFYDEQFDLTTAPPFRLLVARGAGRAGGDRLLVCANHVLADGVGTLRFARTVCRAYRGEDLDDEPVDLESARSVLSGVRPSGLGRRLDLLGSAASRLERLVDRPARIAADGASGEFSWGFVHRRVDDDLARRVVADRPDGATVNDVMLAALHLAIDDWNADRGEDAGTISLMMPVNVRPEKWFYEVVGMFTLFESITTRPRHREDPRTTLQQVTEQTTAIKEGDRAAAFLESLDLIPGLTPVGLRGQLPALLRGPGEGLLDTAMLSNLGRVPGPAPSLDGGASDGGSSGGGPSSGESPGDGPSDGGSSDGGSPDAASPGALWFSPPCWRPTPLGVGVATVDGTVRLVFRYATTTFDREAAEAFADRYLERLADPVA